MAKYRGAPNTHEIGRALNVAHVLKANVRREHGEDCHDRIHFNAQLIDTRTDAHVWTQEYDRDLNDLFALQCEIAKSGGVRRSQGKNSACRQTHTRRAYRVAETARICYVANIFPHITFFFLTRQTG